MKFSKRPRKSFNIATESFVQTKPMAESGSSPLLVESKFESLKIDRWAHEQKDYLRSLLAEHGAILFRGFAVSDVSDFEAFIVEAFSESLSYQERSSPRQQVKGNVYTSTEQPCEDEIFLHNEQSYNLTFPLKILFYCHQQPDSGGETPIADCRRVYSRLSDEVIQAFLQKKYCYSRNLGSGFGLHWREVFQTDDKAAVEEYCQKNDILFEWQKGDILRTKQIREAVARHPETGELCWFNHATFFHFSTLAVQYQKQLNSIFSGQNLPNNTCFGNGDSIPSEYLKELRSAYESEKFSFRWQKGDILLLDNILFSHGRNAFSGSRKVYTGFAQLVNWSQVRT
uniref:SyrP-like protein n=1 Tax=Rheinheimera sp. BAL341 TaxID=1708203 RepID=A0A486XMP0_9GAMM